jgi:hypothetical protein
MDNVQSHNICNASLLKEMSGESVSVIGSAYCSNKTILYPRNAHVAHTNEEVFNSLDR